MTVDQTGPIDRYAVIGHPVEHSLSPRIHALFARQTHQFLVYERLDCPPDGFLAGVRAFAANEGRHAHARWNTRGCNVTVPFKFEAYACAPRHSARAELAQAANTLRFDDEAHGGWWADNTDGAGLVRDIEDHCGVALRGARVLLVGAGGAAAGVLGPLLERGPHELVIVNRTQSKAEPLLARHVALAQTHGATLRPASLDRPGERYDVVINATAASLGGQALALPQSACKPGGLAVDLMYGPAAQPFMAWAHAAGAHAVDGLGMLVEQAAESFFLWRDVRPHTAPVLAELREYLKHR